MRRLRGKLTYSNVISTVCLFLLIGGGTAFAASQLGKNSVGSKQLKKNAVTAAKIKKNAVTGAKIKAKAIVGSKLANGAVTGAKIGAGTVSGSNIAGSTITGANINAPSTPFTQAVARLRTSTQQAFSKTALYSIGSYTQPAGEDDQYLATLNISFAGTCEAPREAEELLLRDVSSPPTSINELIPNIVGIGVVEDEGTGATTRTMSFGPIEGIGSMYALAPSAPTSHSFSVLGLEGKCKTGSGISLTGGALDILGTK
ncbi:MAG TPA: hypothetical protein VMH33_05315 [Solirubrobacterales bacterium]|nr:hypothetical protein [Solirubrobacterales bacterium]